MCCPGAPRPILEKYDSIIIYQTILTKLLIYSIVPPATGVRAKAACTAYKNRGLYLRNYIYNGESAEPGMFPHMAILGHINGIVEDL